MIVKMIMSETQVIDIKENDTIGKPKVDFEFAEKTETTKLRVCDVCLRFRYDTILFVNSAPLPYTWNCICAECLDRLSTKILLKQIPL